ncbi:UDP-glycosyltransferase 71C3-like [Humulus lupulus]|uniref:UDP-glycosyltransferase 71C3-like n=1 Tax=Humulus lupulus TaxID=3486 RepID=UPI002B40CC77|nr:UDP-glycosyltransferase 71C3-like [Humulus lupulus]
MSGRPRWRSWLTMPWVGLCLTVTGIPYWRAYGWGCIATWHVYAEQQLNAFAMVREFDFAVELILDYMDRRDDQLVTAEEIGNAIKQLMVMSEMARKAVEEG